MAKYFTFYPIGYTNGENPYSVYYDQISENNYANLAYTNALLNNFKIQTPGEFPYNLVTAEVPDSASSVIVVGNLGPKVFPLVSTPPTAGTLFLTFDTL